MKIPKLKQQEATFKRLIPYINDGIDPGPGLRGLITNDLAECMRNMDPDDTTNLRDYYYWMVENAQHGCWGSSDKCNQWIRSKENK